MTKPTKKYDQMFFYGLDDFEIDTYFDEDNSKTLSIRHYDDDSMDQKHLIMHLTNHEITLLLERLTRLLYSELKNEN